MSSILHVYQIPDKGMMRVRFRWEAIDPTDALLCKKLGEPRVSTGGVFTDPADHTFFWTETDGYTPLFALGPNGLENGYDSSKDPLAERRAKVWCSVMQVRFNQALVNLQAAGDTFSLDTTVVFPLPPTPPGP
jgi:hypothetical protein